MCLHARLSSGFWALATACAVHIYNRQPARRLKWDTSIKAWSGKVPDVKYFCVFGCKAYVHIHKDARINKLQAKAKVMIFVRYKLGTKGYKFWDPETWFIVVSCDTTFNETSFLQCTENSCPSVQPEQPNQAQPPDDFFPEAVCSYVPAPQHDEPQHAENPRHARVEDYESSDNDDLYINWPYSLQSKSESEPEGPAQDFDWDEWYQQHPFDSEVEEQPSCRLTPHRDNQAPQFVPPPLVNHPQGPMQNILWNLDECWQQKAQAHGDSRYDLYLPIPPRPQHLGTGQHHVPDNAYGDIPPTEAWRQQERDIHQDQREEWQGASPPEWQPSPQMNVDPPEFAQFFWQILVHATDGFPQTYKEAIKRSDAKQWEQAMHKELKSQYENKTWSLVPRPKNRRIVKCKWVYVIKPNGLYKARLVVKGFTQVKGIDFQETFLPVTQYEAIRFLLAHAALENWEIEALNIKTVFLYGELNEEIYMEQPEGFVKKGQEGHVCRLLKAIYGLKQASRTWNKKLHKTLLTNGFRCIYSDAGVYVHD